MLEVVAVVPLVKRPALRLEFLKEGLVVRHDLLRRRAVRCGVTGSLSAHT